MNRLSRYSPHVHYCREAKAGCLNYYVCRSEQCRDDWQCPACQDLELLHDLDQQAIELESHTQEPTPHEHR